MFKYIILFFFLFIKLTSASVIINEIMYNPSSSDNNNEYVELILDSFVNLTGYKIQDLKSEDILIELKSVNNNFALIVEEDFDFSDIEASVYSVGATIGNNLNNDNDVIIIKDQNDTILDTISYNENWGASGNGKSLCRIPDTTGLWQECSKTIGVNNLIITNFSKIEISEFLPDPIGDDNDNLPEGEWIELYNDHDEDKDLSGLELIDSSNKKIIISDTNVEDNTIIKTKDYLTIYMNGFSGLLNNDGLEVISLFNSNVLIDEVSYSDSREGLSWSKIDDLWQTTETTPGKENKDNSTIEEVIDSNIKIDKVYDLGSNKKAEWGSSIRVKLTLYKGETNKKTISFYIEKKDERITKISKTNVEDKFKSYTMTIPIQLILNCDKKYEDGEYKIVVKGLDVKDTEDIKVSGESKDCKKIVGIIKEEIPKKESIKNENVKEETQQNLNKLTGETIYENTSKEASRLGVFLFIGLLIILTLVLLNERKDIRR